MSKLNQWLTLVANLSVVAGIVFLAAEMRQNTSAIQAQTRDSMTEKQMMFSEWGATSPELATAQAKAESIGMDSLDPTERQMFFWFQYGILREWENSWYQYREGLFTAEEFEPRMVRWATSARGDEWRRIWRDVRETFSPSFRAEIDRIVAEVEQAQ